MIVLAFEPINTFYTADMKFWHAKPKNTVTWSTEELKWPDFRSLKKKDIQYAV